MVCGGVEGKGWYVEVWREKVWRETGGMWRCGEKRVVCRGVEGKGCGGKRVVCGGVEGKGWYVEAWREKGGV